MNYFLNLVFVVFVTCIPLVCAAGDRVLAGIEAKNLLERVKQNQAGLQTISGAFSEERMISTMPVPLHFKGRIYAEPPGFLFLAYEEPIHHIMKVTGDTVIFYVEDAATADQVNMQNGDAAHHPPDLFTWSPSDFKGEILETEQGYVFHNPAIQAGDRQIRITLNKETLMVRSLILQEPGGDITTIVMHDLQINTPIPEAILHYQLPEGVIINKMGQ